MRAPRSPHFAASFAAVVATSSFGCRSAADPPAPAAAELPSSVPLLSGEARATPLGSVARAHDYAMSVESTRECPMEAPFAAKRGSVKLGVEVTIEGTTASEVPVNPFYATLTDEAGNQFSSTLAGCEPGLPSVRVAERARARGYVTFEIPRTSRKLEDRYAPLVIGSGLEELRFAFTR